MVRFATILPSFMKIRTELGGKGAVALSFSANMRFVRPVRHFISALCTLAEYPDDETESIALVTTEILNNSIEHGARGPDDEIHVSMRITKDMFHFEVTDPGKGGEGFASTALDRAAEMPDLEQARGRGLFLIRNYMDHLEIAFDAKTGTRVVTWKARAKA